MDSLPPALARWKTPRRPHPDSCLQVLATLPAPHVLSRTLDHSTFCLQVPLSFCLDAQGFLPTLIRILRHSKQFRFPGQTELIKPCVTTHKMHPIKSQASACLLLYGAGSLRLCAGDTLVFTTTIETAISFATVP